jgi:hypothetical protein
MSYPKGMPKVPVTSGVVALGGGLDLVTASFDARPGAVRGAINYEQSTDGGYQSAGNYEAFDGRPRPSDSTVLVLSPASSFSGVTIGLQVVGQTSGATGVAIAYAADYLALTKATGTFTAGETLKIGATVIGIMGGFDYPITQSLSNTLGGLAEDLYRADITAVPGGGPVRGIAVLGSAIYAWRDDLATAATKMEIYKATGAGWVAVPRYYELSFTGGTTQPAEGSTITKGAASATVKRVILESGAWSGTAAGRYIITLPSAAFTAGAFTTTGAGTIPAAGAGVYHGTQIALLPGGRVETDVSTFSGSLLTRGLYGCDGVNREFELRDDILVPLATGMTIRAKFVKVHKSHLIFAYDGSLQNSTIGNPYQWSAITGAAEVATGDTITGFVAVGGSETAAALMVLCVNSAWVLYGTSAANWELRPLSDSRGSAPYSVQDIGSPLGLDVDGFVQYTPTQAFGNFTWDLASRLVTPLVREKTIGCSVFNKALGRYRAFFSDGNIIAGTPMGGSKTAEGVASSSIAWMPASMPITVVVAYSSEVGGITRTFYGGSDGFVYEADRGRSANGVAITAALKLAALNQRSPIVEKLYRGAYVECSSDGAFALSAGAAFDEDRMDAETLGAPISLDMRGKGGLYDLDKWDACFYDAGERDSRRYDLMGKGCSISPIFASSSSNQKPHRVRYLTLIYSLRKVTR